nr:PREDICTED: pleckstrin homology domain-containing family J member 1 [Lepisosteus oculatus]
MAVMKKRLVKLVVNFLFYFRTDEEEPLGALLLEQCRVEREDSQAFSITFLDESERKYLFECDSQEQCQDWMDSIIRARSALHDEMNNYHSTANQREQTADRSGSSDGGQWAHREEGGINYHE